MEPLILLGDNEASLRLRRMASLLDSTGTDAVLITGNADKYYLTGRVFSGWLLVSREGLIRAFVKRPVSLQGNNIVSVRKPEEIILPDTISTLGLGLTTLNTADYLRLATHFQGIRLTDCSGIMRSARAVKTPYETELIRRSGQMHEQVYRLIPSLYRPGMTDLQLQIEIEHALRSAGCLGQFRISGDSMELFMGNILAGDNADTPSPYDFAMGGGGQHPSLPVGADGTVISPGMSVMVDANGNFTGYMTDMTRTFALGKLTPLALKAHQCSVNICHRLSAAMVPGAKAADLYREASAIACENGLGDFFMGHRQKAGFIGHGVGIEVNESPVIAPKSRDIIMEGNIIALEPKFVIPGTGAVGIENTYCVTDAGTECLTNAPEEIIALS